MPATPTNRAAAGRMMRVRWSPRVRRSRSSWLRRRKGAGAGGSGSTSGPPRRITSMPATSSTPSTSSFPRHDLGLEEHAGLLPHRLADLLDQGAYVLGPRHAEVDEEVRVGGGDLGVADARSLETAGVDEPAGMIPLRVLEHAAGVAL